MGTLIKSNAFVSWFLQCICLLQAAARGNNDPPNLKKQTYTAKEGQSVSKPGTACLGTICQLPSTTGLELLGLS